MYSSNNQFAYEVEVVPYYQRLLIGVAPVIVLSTANWHYGTNATLAPETIRLITGDVESFLVQSPLNKRSSGFLDIPMLPLGYERVISREFIGATVRFYQVNPVPAPTGQEFVREKLWTGTVTNQMVSPQSVKFELTSLAADINRPSSLNTSTACMNLFGEGLCKFVRTSNLYREVLTVSNSGRSVQLTAPVVLNPLYNWELVCGATAFLVSGQSAPDTLQLVGSVMGKPKYVGLREHCNLSLKSCNRYGQTTRFNGNPMLARETLNSNL
jgi:hypothetical protein